ncbi:DUF2798 domain-containing protein [Bosea sp. R86505]|uniref:DUF2798 domain-containing protein n=1 Tax=Bosea sp. R86505 TaxID=3101710 RepID=UPI003671752B
MLGIPRRYSHYVFGILQSGLTSAIAAGIALFPGDGGPGLLLRWLVSWLLAWCVMLPVVIFAAPFIRRLAVALTRED